MRIISISYNGSLLLISSGMNGFIPIESAPVSYLLYKPHRPVLVSSDRIEINISCPSEGIDKIRRFPPWNSQMKDNDFQIPSPLYPPKKIILSFQSIKNTVFFS